VFREIIWLFRVLHTLLHMVCEWNRSDLWVRTSAFFCWWHETLSPCSRFLGLLENSKDLNRLVDWCGANSLQLNVGKCKLIRFSRLNYLGKFSYMLGGIRYYPWSCWLHHWFRGCDGQQDVILFFLSILMLERLWRSWGFWKDCRVSSGIFILFMCHVCSWRLSTQVVYGGLFMTCISIGLSVCRKSSLDTRWKNWDGWTGMIFFHTWTDVLRVTYSRNIY
jgi:hypothetical protein